MIVGSLGEILFYVSEFNVFSLKNELSRTRKAKITKHTPIYGIDMLRHQGREPIEVKFTIELLATLTKMPGLQMQLINNFMDSGRYAYLIIGAHMMGEYPFLITEIEEKLSHYNNMGDFDKIVLDITLIEYVNDTLSYKTKLKSMFEKVNKTMFEDKLDVLSEQKRVVR